ncbi:MAG: transglycosylase domain-containing protein [Anaerolineae bacterium]|nr:transglycosylase domain-containing protein [Anaerolineae bacterium]
MKKAKLVFIKRRHTERVRKQTIGPNLLLRVFGGSIGILLTTTLIMVLSAAGATVGVWAYFTKDLPDAEEIQVVEQGFETIRFYDRTGKTMIYEMVNPLGDRIWLNIDDIPDAIKWATISIEDRDFYTNPGVNLRGLGRAFANELRGLPTQGGSSLTQQLVKNVLIDPEERYEKSYSRKIKEVILSLEITRKFSKDQILEWYLNLNSYGNFAYGIESAAQVYFGKSVHELTIAEIAMLAPIPQYPGLNPIDNWEYAKKRQELTLDGMASTGFLTQEQAEAAKAREIKIKEKGITERFDVIAPHFSLYAANQLEDLVGAEAVALGGLEVYTTIDLELQAIAEEAARKRVRELTEQNLDVNNAAVISLRPRTGEILVMVGSIDYWNKEIDGQVNVALAERQPGSSFKPFTYLTAFSQGYTPATMVLDVRTCPNPNDPSWCPENYPDADGTRPYHGPQRLRNALARSYNIPAVKVMKMVGVGNVIKTAHAMGITTLRKDLDFYGLALTLGGGEVKLIDMAFAYGVVANQGTMYGVPIPEDRIEMGYRELDPISILQVRNRDDQVIWEYTQPDSREIVDPKLTYLLTDIMSDNAARSWVFGLHSKLVLEDRPVAAKTGTTDGWHDCWTVGFTPQIVTTVWMGNTDNTPMRKVTGGYGAAYVWNDVMTAAHEGLPVETWEQPEGIVEAHVCSVSGLLPSPDCPSVVKEIFVDGTQPVATCNIHRAYEVNKQTGRLATPNTPPELIDRQVYTVLPPEADDWVREANIPQPPTEYDDYSSTRENEDIAIVYPVTFGYISQVVEIKGNARNNVRFWKLDYGQGLAPQEWFQIGGDHPYEVNGDLMEYWDVTELDGLYTLRLTVIGHDDSIRQDIIQVTVDNVAPIMEFNHPQQGDVFIKEDDERINIQATVKDNVSLDRVEFFVDGREFAVSTVPPYNKSWTIVMSDTNPVLRSDAVGITRPFTRTDGTVVERYYLASSTVWATRTVTHTNGTTGLEQYIASQVLYDPELDQVYRWFDGGMVIIHDSKGYTETHLIHVVAYDAAGNETKSEQVRVHVVHKKPREESAIPHHALIMPANTSAGRSLTRRKHH